MSNTKDFTEGIYEKAGVFFVPLGTEFNANHNVIYYKDTQDGRRYILNGFSCKDGENLKNIPFEVHVFVENTEVVTTNEEFAIIWVFEGQSCFDTDDDILAG